MGSMWLTRDFQGHTKGTGSHPLACEKPVVGKGGGLFGQGSGLVAVERSLSLGTGGRQVIQETGCTEFVRRKLVGVQVPGRARCTLSTVVALACQPSRP